LCLLDQISTEVDRVVDLAINVGCDVHEKDNYFFDTDSGRIILSWNAYKDGYWGLQYFTFPVEFLNKSDEEVTLSFKKLLDDEKRQKQEAEQTAKDRKNQAEYRKYLRLKKKF